LRWIFTDRKAGLRRGRVAIGDKSGKFHAEDSRGNTLLTDTGPISSQREAIFRIGRLLVDAKMPTAAAIGHRIVQGGPKLRQHCLIDDAVLTQLEGAIAFAPLHIPSALSVIRFAQEHFPGLPQAACFDTTFHAQLPAVAHVLPISRELQFEGIQRYGFHGLSRESIVHQLANDLPNRLVIAHLGNGASVTAVKGGKSMDTSMGLTPTGGVIMGTRSGDLDPGVPVYLMLRRNSTPPCSKNWSIAVPAFSEFRGLAATCGGCVKPRRRTPMHDLPFRCSVIPCASRWPR
jgi:acetate kinase